VMPIIDLKNPCPTVAVCLAIAIVIIMLDVAMTDMEALASSARSRGSRRLGYAYVGSVLINIFAYLGVFFGYYAFRILIALSGLIWNELLKKLGTRR
jgi:hypothetical protein